MGNEFDIKESEQHDSPKKPIFGSIGYLKENYPDKWKIVLSIWIACFVFLLFAYNYHEMAYEEDDVFTQFIAMTFSIAAILATIIYSIKNKKRN